MSSKKEKKQWTFYCLTGKKFFLLGETPEQALTLAGYGGVLNALDFYVPGNNEGYIWHGKFRTWRRI